MAIQRLNPPTLAKMTGIHQVVKAGNTVYIAGQVAIDSAGKVVGKGDIDAQLRQTYANLEAAVKSVGGSLANMVKTTTWIVNPAHFPAIAKARQQAYGANAPVNATLIISALANADWLVEIEGIAVIE